MHEDAKKTALYDKHIQAGGKMVEFAGYMMPASYTGIIDEVHAVRTAIGMFDVSHMGEFTVRGPGAFAFLQNLTTNDVSKLYDGRAQYTLMCRPGGGIVDDLLVYRYGEEDYMMVVNASNKDKDFAWAQANLTEGVELVDKTEQISLLAIQGPKAVELVNSLADRDITGVKYYCFATGSIAGKPATISRTGYTGEDGFELYIANEHAPAIWDAVVAAGAPLGLQLAGLGARDCLRTEAGYSLYGQEIREDTNPLEAGLGWVTKLNKGDFIGQGEIAKVKDQGLARKIVGIEMLEKSVPRQGYPIFADGERIGEVTSGTFSPTLERMVAIAYVRVDHATEGSQLGVEIRGRQYGAQITPMPFYKRPTS